MIINDEAGNPPIGEHVFSIVLAESYGRAAAALAKQIPVNEWQPFRYPVATLAVRCIELSLKAVLLKDKTPVEDGESHKPRMSELLAATAHLDWSPIVGQNAMKALHAIAMSHALRQNKNKVAIVRDADSFMWLMNEVFQRCFRHVLPDVPPHVILDEVDAARGGQGPRPGVATNNRRGRLPTRARPARSGSALPF